MLRRVVLAVVLSCVSLLANAQEYPKGEVFGGYSFLNADFNKSDTGISRQNFNGWEAGAAFNATEWFAVEGLVAGHYRSLDVGSLFGIGHLGVNISAKDYAFMGGPRINFRPVFVHALFGDNHITGSVAGTSASQDAFAAAFGGGVEKMVSSHWGVRGTGDYVMTRHNFFGPNRVNQSHFRVAVGIVYAFGGNGGSAAVPNQQPSQSPAPRRQKSETRSQQPTMAALPLTVHALGVTARTDVSHYGVEITDVSANSPAAQSGLARLDVILAVNGRGTKTVDQLNSALAEAPAGSTVQVLYLFRGTTVRYTLPVALR